MSIINYASKEIQFKIVYYGPALCGKTTNLAYIHSRINPDNRGDLVSLATAADRTLFFDFLPLNAVVIKGFKTKFQLYTVPGQVIYNATRQLVLRSVDGLVFVADSQWDKMEENVESFKNLEENLAKQNIAIDEIPYVVQYNKRDLPNIAPVNYLEFLLNNRKKRVKSYEVVSSTGQNVFAALNAVSQLLLHKFNKESEPAKAALPPGARPGALRRPVRPRVPTVTKLFSNLPPPRPRTILSTAHALRCSSMESIPILTIEDVANIDAVLQDYLTQIGERPGRHHRQGRQRDLAVRRPRGHGRDDHRGAGGGQFRRHEGTRAAHRRGGVQRAVSSGQRQPYFHELGR